MFPRQLSVSRTFSRIGVTDKWTPTCCLKLAFCQHTCDNTWNTIIRIWKNTSKLANNKYNNKGLFCKPNPYLLRFILNWGRSFYFQRFISISVSNSSFISIHSYCISKTKVSDENNLHWPLKTRVIYITFIEYPTFIFYCLNTSQKIYDKRNSK